MITGTELLEALPVAIYTTDAEGRITFYNRAAAELWGSHPELGSSQWCGSWRLYWPDGRPLPHDECPMAIALKEGREVRGVEAIAERPDGTRLRFLPYPTPPSSEAVNGAAHGVSIGPTAGRSPMTSARWPSPSGRAGRCAA